MPQLGTLRSWCRQGETIIAKFGREELHVSAVNAGTLRVVLRRSPLQTGAFDMPEPESVVLREPIPVKAEGPETGPVTISCGEMSITVGGPEGAIRLGNGAVLAPHWDNWQIGVSGTLQPAERIYGLGQPDQNGSMLGLDRRGRAYDIFNAHNPRPSRMILPVFYSSLGYGVFIDNSWTGRIDMGAASPDTWFYTATGGELDVYLLAGNLAAAVAEFTALTGRAALPPRWTLGFIQSKFGYRSRAEVEQVVAEFRRRQIPCDAIALDLYWFQRMGDLCFDEDAFPEPAAFLDGLRNQGVKVIAILQPYVSTSARLFSEGEALGYFVRFPDGRCRFPFWYGDREAALIDFTNPAARDWFARQLGPLLDMQVAGWWLDQNEPEQHYPEMLHHGGPAAKVHNRFSLRMCATIVQAQEQSAPGRRPFVLSRSGWIGMSRLGAAVWTGDAPSTFHHLSQQPALALSAGLCGLPWWSSDVGGFGGSLPSTELYIRWLQFGCFCPIARPHGYHQPREPWSLGTRVEEIAARFIKLRQRLIPYTYTAMRETCVTGAPLLRPLVWEFPDDPFVADVADIYMLGRSLLVGPVLAEGERKRRLYLPAGDWYDFTTRQAVGGGQWIDADAPVSHCPLYVRAGCVIPLAEPQQYDDEAPLDSLTLTVWPGPDWSGYDLYEDDGVTTAYRDGVFAVTHVAVAPKGKAIEIGVPEGPYAERLPNRRWQLEVVREHEPTTVTVNGCMLPRAGSAETLGDLSAGWRFDPGDTVLYVKLNDVAGIRVVEIQDC